MTDPMIAETIRHNLYERRIARRLGDHGAAAKYEARVLHAIDFARRLDTTLPPRECDDCNGTGEFIAAIDRIFGEQYGTCQECGGSGRTS